MLALKQQMATTWANNGGAPTPPPASGPSEARLAASPGGGEAKIDESKSVHKGGGGSPSRSPLADPGSSVAVAGSSGSEVYRLAEQLSVQTEYTNKLLSQMQALEEQSLARQREVQGREMTLRRTMEAMDQARADANMLRTRLQNANDVIEKFRREQQDALVETHDRDRKMATMQKLVDDQAHELDRVTGEARGFAEQLERLQRAHADAQGALENATSMQKEEAVSWGGVAREF
jgi:DNA repair exonuclease SbcCD ATPase subunit